MYLLYWKKGRKVIKIIFNLALLKKSNFMLMFMPNREYLIKDFVIAQKCTGSCK